LGAASWRDFQLLFHGSEANAFRLCNQRIHQIKCGAKIGSENFCLNDGRRRFTPSHLPGPFL
jgi:hypothetical protein